MNDSFKERQQVKLEQSISIIVNDILQELATKPEAIFLCGGYGRGEGAWYKDDKGNIMPYNDFDLLVITDHPLSNERNNLLRKKLANKIGINWVDIDYCSRSRLSSLKSTINNIDLIKGSCCVYGNANVLDVCPQLNPSEIGLPDILFLYRVRIWTFLGSWTGDFHDMDTKEALFFKNQMAKATLSVCDLLLIKNHRYTSSYVERANLICNIYKDNLVLCRRVNWAINEKLRPSTEPLTKKEVTQLYREVKSLFIKALSDALDKHWRYFENPKKTKRWFYFHTKQLLVELYTFLYKRTNASIKSMDIFIAQTYVFLAEDNGIINTDYLYKAQKILKKWGYINRIDYDWYTLHSLVAEARNN